MRFFDLFSNRRVQTRTGNAYASDGGFANTGIVRGNTPGTISVTLADIPAQLRGYVHALEIGESTRWCKCLWAAHPDDVLIKPGHCRLCSLSKGKHSTDTNHVFTGVRRRKIDTHPECPVHTREGLILGFIDWLQND